MTNEKGDVEPPSQEEIARFINQYTKDISFFTEPIFQTVEAVE
jgi:hypothetical protein